MDIQYIKATSQLDEYEIKHYIDKLTTKSSLTPPNEFISSNVELLTELSKKNGSSYESMAFNFSDFAKNLYTLLSAVNDKLIDLSDNIHSSADDIAYLSGVLAGEIRDRKANDSYLSGVLDREIADRLANDRYLSGVLDREIADRLANDRYLSGVLSGEINARMNADKYLSSRISAVENGDCDKYLNKVNDEITQIVAGPVEFSQVLSGTITNAQLATKAKWA